MTQYKSVPSQSASKKLCYSMSSSLKIHKISKTSRMCAYNIHIFSTVLRRCGGLMVSALDSGASAPGLSPSLEHCIVFLGKTLYSHGASLHPGV